jgi:peptide/nickel transport system permease protein
VSTEGAPAPAAGEAPPPASLARLAWRRFRRHRLAMVGAVVLAALAALALAAPLVAPYRPDAGVVTALDQPPSRVHWMGTDDVGRDEFTRVLYGGRVSLAVGLLSSGVAVGVGLALGSVAGYFGGLADGMLMRAVDVGLSVPPLMLLLVVAATFRPSTWLVILSIGLTNWMHPARVVRAQFLALRQMEFVEAARAMGASAAHIVFREILPNAVGPVIVAGTLLVGESIVLESAMSWLGLGIQPPTASWGNMLAEAQSHFFTAPWLAIFPGAMISLTVLAFNLVGDGLRDALDPRPGSGRIPW